MFKLFYDAEFTGFIDPEFISIGIVGEDGSEFYAEFTEFTPESIKDPESKKFIMRDVIPKLQYFDDGTVYTDLVSKHRRYMYLKSTQNVIRIQLDVWIKSLLARHKVDKVEFWSDVYAYDWILLNKLWKKLPEYVYYIPFDLATFFKVKGIDPDISREYFVNCKSLENKHNALHDAKMIKMCWEKLQEDDHA